MFFNADEYNQDPLCDPWWVKSVAHTYPYMITDQFKGVKRGSIPSTPCCPAGKYFDMDKPRTLICSSCPLGKFSGPAAGALNCSSVCPAGAFVAGSACASCPKGRFTAIASNAAECTKCSRGTYNAEAGQASCTDCSSGKFNPDAGGETEKSCKNCPKGKFSGKVGSGDESDCKAPDSSLESDAAPAGQSDNALPLALTMLAASGLAFFN